MEQEKMHKPKIELLVKDVDIHSKLWYNSISGIVGNTKILMKVLYLLKEGGIS